MNALEIRDLSKNYGNFNLSHLNLTLPGGCIMGLVGENGAGKSTTINTVCFVSASPARISENIDVGRPHC